MNDVSEDDNPWPFIEPSEDPLTSNDSIYCDVFRGYFHPTLKQKIIPNHPMVSRIVECNCKLHLVLVCSDSEEDDEEELDKALGYDSTRHWQQMIIDHVGNYHMVDKGILGKRAGRTRRVDYHRDDRTTNNVG